MPIREQAALGRVQTEKRTDQNMGGMLLYGEVIRVYPENHTADVKILNNQYGSLISANFNNGKYACRILESYAGFDSQGKLAYGKITPIQSGNYVLIGFINNYKSQPVILGCFHSINDTKNVLTNNQYRSVVVSMLQDYMMTDKDGGFELVHHTGAFLIGTQEEINEKMSHENMELVSEGTVRKADYSKPINVLASIRNASKGFTKIFINGVKSIFRISRSTNGTNGTFFELDEEGNFRIKLQQDSAELDSGNNYTEFKLSMKTGEVIITQLNSGNKNIFNMTGSGGIKLDSNMNITISATKDISINSSASITLNSDNINISVKE